MTVRRQHRGFFATTSMSRYASNFLNCDGSRAPVAAIGQLQLPILDAAFPRVRCLVWITSTLLLLLALIQLT